ncbi:DUF2199 domain-containing protein [Dactylosporangium aurantiacum]|uniref:DUF2199 domain-containing protein n=1 Tax=Dactylosporangium aurantiacum TaxID=35754 RepID=A0A9Q9MG19_9ACTN|nr:DUF2199 domain-containing protein [Dactylosporangium aurantiacum]MDG6102454.1 DUF2199 domain-containing protein [Dactylosporangium aurantiacum]UWZ53260.1 DUF2199 domain-containing protein [Dactylosporangium aurantiacum]
MTVITCTCCGQDLGDVPSMWSFSAPDTWGVPGVGGASFLEEELCFVELPELEEQHFFIRALIEVPIHGVRDALTYSVWVSLSAAGFARAVEQWEDPQRAAEPPFFGQLANRIPGYPETLRLRVRVHTRPPGLRPLVEVRAHEHPLAAHQRDGIAAHELTAVAAVCGG